MEVLVLHGNVLLNLGHKQISGPIIHLCHASWLMGIVLGFRGQSEGIGPSEELFQNSFHHILLQLAKETESR